MKATSLLPLLLLAGSAWAIPLPNEFWDSPFVEEDTAYRVPAAAPETFLRSSQEGEPIPTDDLGAESDVETEDKSAPKLGQEELTYEAAEAANQLGNLLKVAPEEEQSYSEEVNDNEELENEAKEGQEDETSFAEEAREGQEDETTFAEEEKGNIEEEIENEQTHGEEAAFYAEQSDTLENEAKSGEEDEQSYAKDSEIHESEGLEDAEKEGQEEETVFDEEEQAFPQEIDNELKDGQEEEQTYAEDSEINENVELENSAKEGQEEEMSGSEQEEDMQSMTSEDRYSRQADYNAQAESQQKSAREGRNYNSSPQKYPGISQNPSWRIDEFRNEGLRDKRPLRRPTTYAPVHPLYHGDSSRRTYRY